MRAGEPGSGTEEAHPINAQLVAGFLLTMSRDSDADHFVGIPDAAAPFSPLSVDNSAVVAREGQQDEASALIAPLDARTGCCKGATLLPGPPHVKNIIVAELCERCVCVEGSDCRCACLFDALMLVALCARAQVLLLRVRGCGGEASFVYIHSGAWGAEGVRVFVCVSVFV